MCSIGSVAGWLYAYISHEYVNNFESPKNLYWMLEHCRELGFNRT